MEKMFNFKNEKTGASLVSYGLLVGLIAVISIFAVLTLGLKISSVYNKNANAIALAYGTDGEQGNGGQDNNTPEPPDSDKTPNSFSIPSKQGESANNAVISQAILLDGFNEPIPVSVNGDGNPQISKNGTDWGTSINLAPGDVFYVRLTPDVLDGSDYTAMVNANGVKSPYVVVSSDTIPDAFSIPAVEVTSDNGLATSSPINLTGFNTPVSVSVSGEGSPQISLDGSNWSDDIEVSPGEVFYVSLTTGALDGSDYTATVSVNNVTADFVVSSADAIPDAFTISGIDLDDSSMVAPDDWVTSEGVTLSGYDVAISITSSGGTEISIAGGSYTTSGTISPGDSFIARIKAPSVNGTATGTITAGGVSGNFVVTLAHANPSITSTSLPNGSEGASYNTTLTASYKGAATGSTWSATGLPSGMTINNSGKISGIAIAGTYSVDVTVTDSLGGTASKTLSMTTLHANPVIQENIVNYAQNGKAISPPYQLQASFYGGAVATSWSATGLSPGISISSAGILTGTPTTSTMYGTLTVHDSLGGTGTLNWNVNIKSPDIGDPF